MSEKKRLGKGLGALIPEVEASDETVDTNEIAIDLIKPNPFQPRREFENEKLKELAASIKEHGVLQAIVVCPEDEVGNYVLVAGERRCRAAKLAGLKTIPAVVRNIDKNTMLEIALIENLQREDLNPVEEANAYRRLMKEYNYTQDDLARRIGCSRPAIANSIRLLSLPEIVIEALANNEMTPGQARPLLGISDPKLQQQAAHQIIKNKLSAREAEKISNRISRQREKDRGKSEKNEETDPIQDELQLQMQRSLGTKVKIKQAKNGGTIEIYYYSDEDLERLMEKLLPEGL